MPSGAFSEVETRDQRPCGQRRSGHGAPPLGPGRGPAPQYSTAAAVASGWRRASRGRGGARGGRRCGAPTRVRRYVGSVAYWVLKAILTPIFFLLWRVKVEGRENIPKEGPAVLRLQSPVVQRLLLHPAGRQPQGHLPGQGGVLRHVEDGLVLPAAGQIPIQRGGGSASERALDTARNEVLGKGISSASTPKARGRWTSTCTRVAPA